MDRNHRAPLAAAFGSYGRVLLLATLSSASACAASSDEPTARPGEGRHLSVLTYNVNFGLGGDAETTEVIRSANADIVLLQETTPEWERSLSRDLAGEYPHMTFRHCCGAGGLAVLSRHAFEERDYIAAPSGWFPAWRLVAGTPIGQVQLLNVHLHPPVSDSGNWVVGQFTTRGVRRDEIRAYHDHLDEGVATIIAGDFNENRRGRALRFLADKGYSSVNEEFHPETPTWRWQTKLGPLRAQLDHIVYSPELRPLRARVLEGGRSDHLAVLAVFAVR